MIIKKFKKSDSAALLALIEKMISYHRRLDSYYRPFDQFPDWEETFQNWLKDKEMMVFLVEIDGKIVGYLRAGVEKAPDYATAKKIGIIYDVFISEPERRRGIARKLFDSALEWFNLKKAKRLELSVDARNPGGIKFWNALGFFEYKLRMRKDL